MQSSIVALAAIVSLCTPSVLCSCQAGECTAPAEWFAPGGTPPVPLDFKVHNEEDECEFYQWAWQTFLWVTQPEDAITGPRFTSDFKTPNDLFRKPDGGSLAVLALPRADSKDAKKPLSLSMRTFTAHDSNTPDVSTTAFDQATSQGVVVDRNNRPLFYGIHVNERYVQFVRQPAPKGLGLTSAEQIKDVAKTAVFPPGCIVLKSAWRVLSEDEKQPDNLARLKEKFFITEALVPVLFSDETGRIKANLEKSRTEMVALVALHVVGTITNHPEFIWATFEHDDNAPVLNGQPPAPNAPIDATRDYTFYRRGTIGRKSNKNPVAALVPEERLRFVDATKQTLQPIVDIYRLHNSGDQGVGEDEDVKSLNESAKAQLKRIGSVWHRYSMVGTVWLKANSLRPDTRDFGDDLQGETKLSNSTMETFTQVGKANCFSCHHTEEESVGGKTLPGLNVKISHILRNAYLPNH